MGRVPRWRLGNGIYHVLNRGLNNSLILSQEQDRDYFTELLDVQRRKFKLNVYHYVVMSNHFHIAVEVLDMKELSAYIGSVCSLYSRYWHGKNGGGYGPIWQGRYRSIAVQKEEYMIRLGRYIERNPVVAQMEGIEYPSDYRWSSADAYVSGKNDPIVSVDRNPYWKRWGNDNKQRKENYTAYIRMSVLEDVELFNSPLSVIGDDDFKAKIRTKYGRPSIRGAGRPRKLNTNK